MEEKIKTITRFHPEITEGLSQSQVEKRKEEGLVNYDTAIPTKTVGQIIKNNVFTLFNFLNFFLGFAVLLVGSYKNLTFLGIVFCNTAISTFQEIHAKKIIDKLSIIASQKVQVIRNGKPTHIAPEEMVLDDIVSLSVGNQIVTDCYLKQGTIEVNESFITGESDPILKKEGDMLLSGSFVISGNALAQVEHIGNDNYTSKISSGAKYVKKVNSEIMKSLQKIIKMTSFLIVPIGILLFYRQITLENNTLTASVVNTVAALIGMIPEGLVLLTSTVLAVSIMRLAKNHVLVQELYCIETLARVDVICLDKTGTITEGCMEVADTVLLKNTTEEEVEEAIAAINEALKDKNPTALALRKTFPHHSSLEVEKTYPFSSDKKYSAVKIKDRGTYVLGAPEFLLEEQLESFRKEIEEYAVNHRVILLGITKEEIKTDKKVHRIEPKAFILLRDKIRKEAKDTLKYFKDQNVAIKIISGDSKDTVLSIAKRAGLSPSLKAIDAKELTTNEQIEKAILEYDVFGRVSPLQKKEFVQALKRQGHTVAMTGDGVNDVLALKEADCSIAMAEGSDAARNVSQLVLLQSNFDAMPKVVLEGRRTINNIERSASLFLVKTIYATILAVMFLFLTMPYPFIPIQLSLTSVVTIGIPSFILALEPNKERIKGQFLKNVISKAMPAAFTIVCNILLILLSAYAFHLKQIEVSTLSVIMTGYTGFILLYNICHPFNRLRLCLFIAMFAIFIVGIFALPELFSLATIHFGLLVLLFLLMYLSLYLYKLFSHLIVTFLKKKSTIS